jgi:hypothetical protein
MTDDLESRLRDSLHAEADTADHAVPPGTSGFDGRGETDSLTAIRSKVRTVRRRRNTLAALGAVAVVVAGFAGANRLADGDDGQADVNVVDSPDNGTPTTAPDTSSTSTPTTAADASTTTSESTSTTPTTATTATPGANSGDPDILGDGFQPLWPFPTRAEAEQWQQESADTGAQPWHLDPEETALNFTQGFLGFTDITQVVGSSDIRANDAWVSVGYTTETGTEATAATIHLMRFGDSGDDTAPWEVVGTRDADTELLLERPDYGTTARSPMTVGGYITGVDESLRVTVRQSSSAEPLGESCCIPAGGTESPWETEVTFGGASDPAVTVIVSTGGHVQDVERFAITGLRS